jgi:hypothetical protein
MTGGAVRISGLTVANGNAPCFNNDGGGIHNSTSLTISDCVIINNNAGGYGGGVFNQGNLVVESIPGFRITGPGLMAEESRAYGSIVLLNTTINNNGATFGGGGCFFRWATYSMTNVTISGNSTAFGAGGFWSRDSVGSISSSSVAGKRGWYPKCGRFAESSAQYDCSWEFWG